MKAFKNVLIGLIILLAAIILIGFFLPSKIHLERSLTIKAPKEVLFNQVNNLRCWEDWSPWHKIDTAMKITYKDPFTGTGASFSWTSNNKKIGQGKITILYSKPYDSIVAEMDFMKQGTAQGYHLFQDTDSGTLVTWGFGTDMGKNPFRKYFGLMMDKYVGNDFETGLKNLDSIANTLSPYLVEMKQLNEFAYTSIRQTCKWEEVSNVMAISYSTLMSFIQSSGGEMNGPPYAIYHKMDEGTIDLETGIPTSELLNPRGNIITGTFNQTSVAATDYYGFYDNLGDAHGALQDWIIKMKLEPVGAPIEMYITDPSSEADTSKWLTRIYYPVAVP
ncbi:MAG: SRPBCC family protein [Bacteroidales bacterium]|nr:SRPBCC family protein [Bacteroidales bacterium]